MRGVERGTEDLNVEQLVALARILGVTAATLVQDVEPIAHDGMRAADNGAQRPPPVSAGIELEEKWTAAQRFGSSLRAYRRANMQRPLDRVARAAGVPHSTVAYIERGRIVPRTSLAVLLADACGVGLSRLFSDAEL